jgi:hypothetical protein
MWCLHFLVCYIPLDGDEVARIVLWIPLKMKKFKVRLFFHELSTIGGSSFPWRSIWKVKSPFDSEFFCVDKGS